MRPAARGLCEADETDSHGQLWWACTNPATQTLTITTGDTQWYVQACAVHASTDSFQETS